MRLGLTGSIGMGKTTIAGIFHDFGVPVWDADLAVRTLYDEDAHLRHFVKMHCPDCVADRVLWRAYIAKNPDILPKLEAMIHPKLKQSREIFLQENPKMSLCDIPLLFETGLERIFDKIIVVSAPAHIQKARIMARPGADARLFEKILARQMPDQEKRARAHIVIETDKPLDETRSEIARLLVMWGYEIPKGAGLS